MKPSSQRLALTLILSLGLLAACADAGQSPTRYPSDPHYYDNIPGRNNKNR